MTTLNHVIVKAPERHRYRLIHDQKIAPPCSDKQILAALQQQYDVLIFDVDDDKLTAIVGERATDETE